MKTRIDSQIHRDVVMANRPKLVEKGQFLALHYPVRQGNGGDDD